MAVDLRGKRGAPNGGSIAGAEKKSREMSCNCKQGIDLQLLSNNLTKIHSTCIVAEVRERVGEVHSRMSEWWVAVWNRKNGRESRQRQRLVTREES